MGDVKMKDAGGAGGPAKAEGGGKAGAAASGQERLAMDDAIMEPWVWEVVKQCVQGGAKPDTLTELLSDGYHGYAQMINLMCEWHVLLGDDKVAVDSEVRGYLKKIILRDFDPTVADSIFEKAGSPPAWLDNMVKDPEWRDLIYELNTKHPGCTLMGYAMAQIQNVGLEAVKMCPEAASANLAMFADMLKLSMAKLCDPSREVTADDVVDLKMLACHNEYAFVFVLSVLRAVGQNEHAPAVRRIAQELHAELVSRGRGRQAEVYASIVSGGSKHEGAMTPLTSMLGQRKTNPSDILTLHKLYTGPVESRPPGSLMQHPAFLDLLVQASFDPKVKINAQFVDKYTWLLAYAVSAKEGDAGAVEEGEAFAANIKAISGVQKLSKDDEQTFSDASLAVLREGIETSRACSMGILHWLGGHLKSPDFYESGGGFERLSPYYVRIIEHVALTHVTQREAVLLLMASVWDMSMELSTGERPRAVGIAVDMGILLLRLGTVLRVMSMFSKRVPTAEANIQCRCVSKVLGASSPPYSPQFVEAVLTLFSGVSNLDILASNAEAKPLVGEFIDHVVKANGGYKLSPENEASLKRLLTCSWS